ncbi:MAG: type II toxin-antitoxin system VapC family toxin [Rhodomicrobium sp.]
MIVLDSSAIIAILEREPEHEKLREIIAANASRCSLSVLNYFETATVIFARRGVPGLETLKQFLELTGMALVPFGARQAEEALLAFQRYGKGVHPETRLNLCDCAAYALAKSLDAPLLFKGNDFSSTDISPAIAS